MPEKKKGSNPLGVYAVASQFAFAVLSPLLIFIVGGYFVSQHFGWPDWAMLICVALGIIFMLCGGISHLQKLIRMYARDDKEAPKVYMSREDNDYYDDYTNNKHGI